MDILGSRKFGAVMYIVDILNTEVQGVSPIYYH